MVTTMATVIRTDAVLYTVREDDREVWRKEVPFGRAERFNAGGGAFVDAAREQARVAESCAMHSARQQ